MNDRRERIVNATLELIEESGLASATIRAVSKRAHVALRTLYLYFEHREAMIGVAINEFFNRSITNVGAAKEARTLNDVMQRFDRLVEIIKDNRNYSAALAPIYFSENLDSRIYEVLKSIALSHVSPFLDIELFGGEKPEDTPLRNLVRSQLASIEYSVINEALNGRLPEQMLAVQLKLSVLTFIAGFHPEPPTQITAMIRSLSFELA